MNARERLAQVLKDIGELKGNTSDAANATRMADLILEGKNLRSVIETENDADALNEWASTSAGRIQIASGAGAGTGAELVGFTPAGATEVRTEGAGRSAVRMLAEEYGEGVVDGPTRTRISSAEYKKAFRAYVRSGGDMRVMDTPSYRLLNESSDVAGGFLVPEDIANMIVMREPAPTRMAARVTQLSTSRDTLSIPRVNYSTDDKYTTGIRVAWTGGETNQSASTNRVTDPTFGRTQVAVFTAMLSLAISNDMIEDSAFPLLSFIAGKFGETVELVREDMILNGSGIGQPTGILSRVGAAWSAGAGSPEDTVLYVPSGTNGSISAGSSAPGAGFLKCAMSLPEQYDENAAWVFNKQSTGMALSQLTDSNGRQLWGAGLQDSGLVPGYANKQLVGYPTLYSAFMPNVADGAYPMLFGDFKGHFLINRIGFTIQILRERYAEENQVVVLGRLRFGGAPVEPFKIRAYKAHSS